MNKVVKFIMYMLHDLRHNIGYNTIEGHEPLLYNV